MQLARSGRFVFVMQWIVVLLLPLHLALGRALFGAELGWTAVFVTVLSPVLILLLLAPAILTLFDPETRRARRTRTAYGVASFVLWGAVFVCGLAVPEASDPFPRETAIQAWTGDAISEGASVAVFAAAAIVSVLAYVAVITVAIAGIGRGRRMVTS